MSTTINLADRLTQIAGELEEVKAELLKTSKPVEQSVQLKDLINGIYICERCDHPDERRIFILEDGKASNLYGSERGGKDFVLQSGGGTLQPHLDGGFYVNLRRLHSSDLVPFS